MKLWNSVAYTFYGRPGIRNVQPTAAVQWLQAHSNDDEMLQVTL